MRSATRRTSRWSSSIPAPTRRRRCAPSWGWRPRPRRVLRIDCGGRPAAAPHGRPGRGRGAARDGAEALALAGRAAGGEWIFFAAPARLPDIETVRTALLTAGGRRWRLHRAGRTRRRCRLAAREPPRPARRRRPPRGDAGGRSDPRSGTARRGRHRRRPSARPAAVRAGPGAGAGGRRPRPLLGHGGEAGAAGRARRPSREGAAAVLFPLPFRRWRDRRPSARADGGVGRRIAPVIAYGGPDGRVRLSLTVAEDGRGVAFDVPRQHRRSSASCGAPASGASTSSTPTGSMPRPSGWSPISTFRSTSPWSTTTTSPTTPTC